MAHATTTSSRPTSRPTSTRTSTRSLLRFITCGSVDDGKSTLIGRLLYESQLVFEDHLAALEADSKKVGTQGGDLDFALLVDGLAAEREQGITIDVAYRFFSTERRKFIVADTPGHEQYTRNMVTGASTADLAVILVDARKGVLTQTRRHSYLVSLLGIRHVVLAVNKLDLVDYSQEVFDAIEADYRAFAAEIGLDDVTCIPMSALRGDNITEPSAEHALVRRARRCIGHLETVEVDDDAARRAVPACRCSGSTAPTSTSAASPARSSAARSAPATRVRVAARRAATSTVARIVTFDGDLDEAVAGQSVTLDARRRDRRQPRRRARAPPTTPPASPTSSRPTSSGWTSTTMLPGRPYLLKIGARTVGVDHLAHPKYKVNVNTLEHTRRQDARAQRDRRVQPHPRPADRVRPLRREPRHGRLHPHRPAHQRHRRRRPAALRAAPRRTTCTGRRSRSTSRGTRALEGPPARAWCGSPASPGAGKSTIANLVEQRLHALGVHTYLLDGDNVRHGLNQRPRLHRGRPGREHPPRRRGRRADGRRRPHRARVVHLAVPRRAPAGPRPGRRRASSSRCFVDTPLEVAEQRDPQGPLRQGPPGRARQLHRHRLALRGAGEPELHLETVGSAPEQLVEAVLERLAPIIERRP